MVAGKPDESLLIQAVAQTHAELKMPPSASFPTPPSRRSGNGSARCAPWPAATKQLRLPARDRGQIRPKHWAFQPIKAVSPPKVKNQAAVGSPVDAFVIARLDAAGLKPSPPASKRTLIRRATVDLWGVPPTAEEVEAFESDGSPASVCAPGRPPAGVSPATASAGAGTGSTSPAMPTPRATSSPRSGVIRLPTLIAIT